MADISEYIREIETASRGEAVRDSIVGALNGMNNSLPELASDALAGRIWRTTITLSTTWTGSDPYHQVVSIDGITNDSLIDLEPDFAAFIALSNMGVKAIWAENDNAAVTVYCIGAKPNTAISMQCLVIETGNIAPESVMESVEMIANKVTSIGSSSTDTQYPSAKAVYDLFGSGGGGDSGDMQASVYDSDLTVANAGGIKAYVEDEIEEAGLFIAKYGTSTYAEVLDAYLKGKIVYCRASSSSNPASGSQNRMAFLAYVNSEETPTEFEFQYYRSVASHSATQQGDQVFVYKLNASTGWTVTTREATTKIAVGSGLTTSYSNGVLTISLA